MNTHKTRRIGKILQYKVSPWQIKMLLLLAVTVYMRLFAEAEEGAGGTVQYIGGYGLAEVLADPEVKKLLDGTGWNRNKLYQVLVIATATCVMLWRISRSGFQGSSSTIGDQVS